MISKILSRTSQFKLTSISLFVLLACVFFIPSANAIEVITNSSSTPENLSNQQLKSIYMGQQTQWPNGVAIKVFILKNKDNTHQFFVKKLLHLYPYQFNRRWQKLVFSGFAVKPTVVTSDQEMINEIANTPGSIGYVHTKIISQGVSYAQLY